MQRIGIRALKEQTSTILRRVRAEGDTSEATYHGQATARLVPVTQASPKARGPRSGSSG
jgi:antitoxin (DNA-binding transcriptional repressor) of toxin-antitoxin stability system